MNYVIIVRSVQTEKQTFLDSNKSIRNLLIFSKHHELIGRTVIVWNIRGMDLTGIAFQLNATRDRKKKKNTRSFIVSIFSMFRATHPFFYIRSPHNVASIDENRRDRHFRLFVSSVSFISRSTVQFTVITRRGCLLSTVARQRLRQ